ncbi:hypothetical protein ACFY3N_26815 [Streptomyces sp. NPDC000348]|uniref:hypothetical protein n=1 Tax=Streptomyces sp. NPDC000348 TaxID=3364538 RepID=UPI0036B44F96
MSAALYLLRWSGPLDEVPMRVEQVRSGGASFARVEGPARAPRGGAGRRSGSLGTHDAPVAAGGAYAALWHSWHGDRGPALP